MQKADVMRLYCEVLHNLTALHKLAHAGKDHTVRCNARTSIKQAMRNPSLSKPSFQSFSVFFAVSVVISCIQDMSVTERVKLTNVVKMTARMTRTMHKTIAYKVLAPQIRDLQQRARRLLTTVNAEVDMANMVFGT